MKSRENCHMAAEEDDWGEFNKATQILASGVALLNLSLVNMMV